MSEALLELKNISVTFGGVRAVDDFSLALPAGGRYAIIGPNGAGKSTVVKCIAGDLVPRSGEVLFAGESMRGLSPARRARRGIARTFQNLELCLSMSVLENILTALDSEASLAGSVRNLGRGAARRERADEALELFGIDRYARVPAGMLPYGIRKLVELSRALVTNPRLLVLDEPVAGLAEMTGFVQSLKRVIDQRSTTVLLIEHDMPTVQTICDMVFVLDAGRTIARGPYAEVAADPRVIEAYLGPPEEKDPGPA